MGVEMGVESVWLDYSLTMINGQSNRTDVENTARAFEVGNKLAILRHFRTPSRMVRIPANYAVLCG